MRINSATIGMESERTYSAKAVRISRFVTTNGQQSIADGTGTLFGGLLQTDVENSGTKENEVKKENGGDLLEDIQNRMTGVRLSAPAISEADELREQIRQIRESCLNYLMKILFPDRYREDLFEVSEDTSSAGSSGSSLWNMTGVSARTVQYRTQLYFEETESTSFKTTGTVKTADGRELSFDLNLNMSRSFAQYYEEEVQLMQVSLCDPLVINLEGNMAEVSDQTFYFDLDCDGVEDEISRLINGSGFLALDRNDDGTINDGSELFGTRSGNGFAELAIYDEDGNGFIDETDAIFDKLKIWMMDENGEPHLYSLKEKGIGAIGLMNTATDFTLMGESHQTNGVIRKTGFFLYEEGGAGTIQHVDLAKHNGAVHSEAV